MTKAAHEGIKADLPLIYGGVITDKSTAMLKRNKFTFLVALSGTKPRVKRAIEYMFDVKVKKINLYYLPRQPYKVGMHTLFMPRYKKAIVTLKEGFYINYYREDNE